MARPTGFEPAISSVTGRRDGPASLRAQTIQCALYGPASLQAQNSRRIVAKPLGFCNSHGIMYQGVPPWLSWLEHRFRKAGVRSSNLRGGSSTLDSNMRVSYSGNT